MSRARCLINLIFSALLVLPAAAATRTLVLQAGRDGYAGVADTVVSGLDWDTPPQYTVNYGRNERLMVSRDGGDNVLLRFDLGAIPDTATVVSATLSLYNLTPSSFSGSRSFPRRVQAFAVLTAWDEGSEVASPLDAPGKHGATGDHAFAYYPGEGVDVPWAARAMLAGSDFASVPESACDVVDEGWYDWDLTAAVRRWVRGEAAGLGVVLRDATGYEDDHRDWRELASSQASDASLRPTLTIVYDPDTPRADAGADLEMLNWHGEAITLDGSASRDRPGGDPNALEYRWRVVTAAYGSSLAGRDLGRGRTQTFTPDTAGEWEIELTVTNRQGAEGLDRVRLRLLSLSDGHPRIFLDPGRRAALAARAVGSNRRWQALLDEADDPTGSLHAKALVGVVTGDASRCGEAIAAARAEASEPGEWSTKAGDIALVYDWCHGALGADDRDTLLAYFRAWAAVPERPNDLSGWGNYWPRWGYSWAMVGLATWGDATEARDWFDTWRRTRFQAHDLAALGRIAAGGWWPEGTVYDWVANEPRVKAVEAWRTATGEDLFLATPWFRERLGALLFQRMPGTAEQWGYLYHPYPSLGDAERNRGSMTNYARIMGLILAARFPEDPLGRQLAAVLATPPTDASMGFLAAEEFLWFDPAQPSEAPTATAHLARGTGTVIMRSGWPSGAADTDAGATYITFQAGDHFSYHQHYDQNAFTLFKGGDLLVDSGVYSGDGLSNHDVNYYVRTVAHNTLVVYNPSEDFGAARPDAASNDGGQRSMSPASRAPTDVDDVDRHDVQYDTADLACVEDGAGYTYALGDATKAYNNLAYSQASDTSLSGNVAKVTRFQRELVYLRPRQRGAGEYLVLYDRVGVAAPSFSGPATKLLFHTLAEPVVDGAGAMVSPGETLYANGRLVTIRAGLGTAFLHAVLPASHNLRVVGGPGLKAFDVFGTVYDWQWDAGEPQPRPVNDFEDTPYGEWRVELEPADDALDHAFVTVIEPTVALTPVAASVTAVTAAGVAGAVIDDPVRPRVVLFSAAVDGTAPSGVISYGAGPGPADHLLVDLVPGRRYRLAVSGQANEHLFSLIPDEEGSLTVSDAGVLAFTWPAHPPPRRAARRMR